MSSYICFHEKIQLGYLELLISKSFAPIFVAYARNAVLEQVQSQGWWVSAWKIRQSSYLGHVSFGCTKIMHETWRWNKCVICSLYSVSNVASSLKYLLTECSQTHRTWIYFLDCDSFWLHKFDAFQKPLLNRDSSMVTCDHRQVQ